MENEKGTKELLDRMDLLHMELKQKKDDLTKERAINLEQKERIKNIEWKIDYYKKEPLGLFDSKIRVTKENFMNKISFLSDIDIVETLSRGKLLKIFEVVLREVQKFKDRKPESEPFIWVKVMDQDKFEKMQLKIQNPNFIMPNESKKNNTVILEKNKIIEKEKVEHLVDSSATEEAVQKNKTHVYKVKRGPSDRTERIRKKWVKIEVEKTKEVITNQETYNYQVDSGESIEEAIIVKTIQDCQLIAFDPITEHPSLKFLKAINSETYVSIGDFISKTDSFQNNMSYKEALSNLLKILI
jgi:hypothetical protein